MDDSKVLIICVNYNSKTETISFVKSIAGLNHKQSVSIVVVNNDETPIPGLTEIKFSSGLTVDVVEAGRNLGYFGGVNLGYREYIKKYGSAILAHVIVSNVDLRFDSSFFVRIEAISLNEGDKVMVVAPRIISRLTGKEQNPFLETRMDKGRLEFYRFLYKSRFLTAVYILISHLLRKFLRGSLQKDREIERDIYAPQGSCMVFQPSYFKSDRAFLYPSFLFLEEVWIAEEVIKKQGSILYYPRLVVYHSEHVSTGLIPSRNIIRHLYDSVCFILDTYY